MKPLDKAKEKTIVIDSLSGFNKWRRGLRSFRIYNRSTTYTFNLQELSTEDNQKVSNLVKAYNNECGCQVGSFFMTIVFCITVISYFVSGGKFSSIRFQQIAELIGITLLAALAGKLLGLLHARWKLIQLSNDINEKLSTAYSTITIN